MYYIFTPIKWALLLAFLIFAITVTSGLILIAIIIGGIVAFYISWSKKQCVACGFRISKRETVCKYCNTIQGS
jgi:hypothetical protein